MKVMKAGRWKCVIGFIAIIFVAVIAEGFLVVAEKAVGV